MDDWIVMLLRSLVILLALAPSVVAYAQQSAPPPPSTPPSAQGAPIAGRNQNDATGNQNSTAPRVPVLKPTEPEQDQERGRSRDQDRDRVGPNESGHEDYNRTIANFTIALAIATIILAVATSLLWWETRKLAVQAKIASEDTKASIKIAERSADETGRAAQAAVDALGSDRAWMVPEGIEPDISHQTNLNGVLHDKVLTLTPRWRNGGRSPAIKSTIYIQYKIASDTDPIPSFEVEHNEGFGIIGQNTVVLGNTIGIGGAELNGFLDNKSIIFVYTKIFYSAPHAPQAKYYSELCVRLVRNGFRLMNNGSKEVNIEVSVAGPQNNAV